MKELTKKKRSVAVAGAVLAIASVGLASARGANLAAEDDPPRVRSAVQAAEDLAVAFETVAESVQPSVVSIQSVTQVRPNQAVQMFPFQRHSDPFGFLFGDPFPKGFFQPTPPQGFAQQGLGTGFILSEEGYVITNHHVVKDADEVTVTLWDESSHLASVVGVDPKTDLAVLHIDADGLVPVRLGDNDDLRVGSWVAAVGNPFGLSSTMTAGIVSAVGRSRVGLADYEDFIQTDAAINPGNSGGPLVNLAGEVVGINTAIFSKSGGYMGIGFAIPINMAKSIVDSLIEDGFVERGFLGVVIQNLDQDLAESFEFEGTDGALVSDVPEDSPAAKAGLAPGDIIVRVGDKHIEDIDTLRLHIADTAPGTIVPIEIVRKGKRKELDVEIGELKSEPADRVSSGPETRDLGMSLETLTPWRANQLRLDGDQDGVLVTSVDPFGPASRAGLRMNDVIVAVEGTPVQSVSDFERAMTSAESSGRARLTVKSGSVKRFVLLRLGN